MSDSEAAARIKNSQSKSFRKLNPHLFPSPKEFNDTLIAKIGGEDDVEHDHIAALMAKPAVKKRIRQSEKPVMNKLETEWYSLFATADTRPQAIKFKVARSAFYKPDFFSPLLRTAWEVKGLKGKNIDRGKLALKCAATAWPEIKFILVWKDEQGIWQEQQVLP